MIRSSGLVLTFLLLMSGCLDNGVEEALNMQRIQCDFESGEVCPPGYICSGVVCVPSEGGGEVVCDLSCGGGETCEVEGLEVACVCGDARSRQGAACGDGGTCTGGACVCELGTENCGTNACHNLKSSTSHCGSCGNACGTNQACSNGSCVCVSGTSDCGSGCVDVNSDLENCGTCGRSCAGRGNTCYYGQCLLEYNWLAETSIESGIVLRTATDGESLFVVFQTPDEFEQLSEIVKFPFDGSGPVQVLKGSFDIPFIAAYDDRIVYFELKENFTGGQTTTTGILKAVDGDGLNEKTWFAPDFNDKDGGSVCGGLIYDEGMYISLKSRGAQPGFAEGLYRFPLDESEPELIVDRDESGIYSLCNFALDDTHVYFSWVNLYKRLQDGTGAPEVISPQGEGPIQLSETDVFFVLDNNLVLVPKSGGTPDTVFRNFDSLDGHGEQYILNEDVVYYPQWLCTSAETGEVYLQTRDKGCGGAWDGIQFRAVVVRRDVETGASEYLDVGPATMPDQSFENPPRCVGLICEEPRGSAGFVGYVSHFESIDENTLLIVTNRRFWFVDLRSQWSVSN